MKKRFYLRNLNIKRDAIAYVANLPISDTSPLAVTIAEEGRTLEQNALLWPLLEAFAEQKTWPVNGRLCHLLQAPRNDHLEAEEWKDLLTAAFRNETQRIAQGLNGGLVMLGARTSRMGKKEFSDFIEFIYATGAELGIEFEERRAA